MQEHIECSCFELMLFLHILIYVELLKGLECMRIALVDGERSEAKPGLKGICQCCHQPVINKSRGTGRNPYWSHRPNEACNRWWEPETEWHRSWKDNFPIEWQEIIMQDEQTGEKHIADIRSSHNFVVEFQHSHIDPQERVAREQFYKNMVWVVDGTRLKMDYSRFLKIKENSRSAGIHGFWHVRFPEKIFPRGWLESSVPVFFDFLGIIPSTGLQDELRNLLWCLLPYRAEGNAILCCIEHKCFVDKVINDPEWFQPQIKQHDNKILNGLRYEQPKRLSYNMTVSQYRNNRRRRRF